MEQHTDNTNIPSVPVYQTIIEVLPKDIDELNHANNVCYVHWMQEIAIEHSAALGWPTSRYTEEGIAWVVRRHTIDYLNQAHLGDKILAETWVAEMKNVSSIRRYRFTRIADQALVATAETRWGFVSLTTGRPTRVPAEMHTIFIQNKPCDPIVTADESAKKR
ncbi:MAG: thioesterase family protein [Thermoguttaceae bacterium]|nr:thioesterase family protein [Thermoguttaceae bacterium]